MDLCSAETTTTPFRNHDSAGPYRRHPNDDDDAAYANQRLSLPATPYDNSITGSKHMNNTFRFLEFHMRVLRAVEVDQDWDEITGNGDNNLWDMMERFLIHRDSLLRVKNEAASMQAIQTEADKVLNSNISSAFGDTNTSPSSKATAVAAGTSPHAPRMYGSRTITARPSPAGTIMTQPFLSQQGRANDGDGEDDRNSRSSFHILAQLMACRNQQVQDHLQDSSREFLPLLLQANTRLAQLQHELIALQSSMHAASTKHMEHLLNYIDCTAKAPSSPLANTSGGSWYENRSRLEEIQSKIQLWSLLASDVQKAI
jgi:hypothetical protein